MKGELEVTVDDAAVVEVVNGDEDAVKEHTAGGELKGEVVLGLRLETSVKFDLRG